MDCKRCGNCCIDIGRTFWKCGDYWRYPVLNRIARNGDHEDSGLPCEMLVYENGQATCMIHELFGADVKPLACRAHAGDHRCGQTDPESQFIKGALEFSKNGFAKTLARRCSVTRN